MALVFKIKFQDTLRRWVVCESWDQTPILINIQELEVKIRELFHISSTSPIVITYVDNENDVVTLADDQDLRDACLVQRLNPLRVDVKLLEKATESCARPSVTPLKVVKDGNAEVFLKAGLPQSTSDAVKQFRSKYLEVAALAARDWSQAALTSSESAALDRLKHPCAREPALGSHSKCNGGKVVSTRIFHRGVQCDGCGMSPIEGPRFKSMKMYDYDLCSDCFEAIGNDSDFQRLDLPVYPLSHGFYHPSCPARWWQSRQYIGASAFRPFFARAPYRWMAGCPGRVQRSSYCPPSDAVRKLDARFVKDVTIFDGTEVAPCTEFTKIWRLRNVGTMPWPQKTQLVRIGGDLFSSEEMVNLELPEGGLACGADVDVSVDLVAPEKVGRYVSHWRLMSPAGHKFGHKVWAIVQVVPQNVESYQFQESLRGEETSDGEEETVTLEIEKNTKNGQMTESGEGKGISISAAMEDLIGSPSKQLMASDSDEGREKPVSFSQKVEDILVLENDGADEFNSTSVKQGREKLVSDFQKAEDIVVLENDGVDEVNSTSVEQDTGKNNSAEESQVVVYPVILVSPDVEQFEDAGSSVIDNEVDGFSVVGKPMENVGWYNAMHQGASESTQTILLQEQSTENITVERMKTNQEMQLQLLESMGFMDWDLNVDLLEKNNQDLDLTLDDLVAVARWDNMLKDLQEMGFNDKCMNCRLLLKNHGSMKLAVKDLVEMEKQKVGLQGF